METNNNSLTGLMPVETIDGIVYLDFSQIIWFDADCKHTLIYVKNVQKATRSTFAISLIEEMLPREFFFRCHRCHIIGLRHLRKFEKGTRQIHLTDNHSVTIAEDRIPAFLQHTNPFNNKNK